MLTANFPKTTLRKLIKFCQGKLLIIIFVLTKGEKINYTFFKTLRKKMTFSINNFSNKCDQIRPIPCCKCMPCPYFILSSVSVVKNLLS